MVDLSLRERLKADADDLRKHAKPIWEILEGPDCDRDRRAFESSLEHLEQHCLCITVMGEFNTGKSTLLNTIIGEEILWTDQLESTAVPTWVRWTEDDEFDRSHEAIVIRTNGESVAMPLGEIRSHTTLNHDSWETVERVEVTLYRDERTDGAPTGIVLVDTPGLNGSAELEARSMHQLGMSHAVVVVVPYHGVGRKSDVALIEKARSIADDVMVVINKCDRLPNVAADSERLRNELGGRVSGLRPERIYTLSAKHQFDGEYPDEETELAEQFRSFQNDLMETLVKSVGGHDSVLKERPRKLLKTIVEAEIDRIDHINETFQKSRTADIDKAQQTLARAMAQLQDSETAIRDLAGKTIIDVRNSVEWFIDRVQEGVQREMRVCVSEMNEATLSADEEARDRLSEWLRTRLQKVVLDRVSRLLVACAHRLIADLEDGVTSPVRSLTLPAVTSIRLNTTDLDKHASSASQALSRSADEVDALEYAVERSRHELSQHEKQLNELDKQCKRLDDLKSQRRSAVVERSRLGSKPSPMVTYYKASEQRQIPRRFLFFKVSPRIETHEVKRQRMDYTKVRQWEASFADANQRVEKIDAIIEPLRKVPGKRDKAAVEVLRVRRRLDQDERSLRMQKERMESERERYRESGLKTRRALLQEGARRALETFFEELPHALKREAMLMQERITGEFDSRFRDAAKAQERLYNEEKERRSRDPGWEQRQAARNELERVLRGLRTEAREPRTQTGGGA